MRTMYIEDEEIFELLGQIEDIIDTRKKIKRGSENEVERRNEKNEEIKTLKARIKERKKEIRDLIPSNKRPVNAQALLKKIKRSKNKALL